MPERQDPKYQFPTKSYPTPSWGEAPVDGISVVDETLIEYVEPNGTGYVKLPEGSPHPDYKKFPNHKLLREEFVAQGTNKRIWCNGYRNEDQYNYSIDYSGDENSHPIFQRRYLVRRDQYSPILKESKFTGIYLIAITNSGSGYDPKLPPSVTIAGGGGSGATAQALVGPNGTVDWIYLTAEGSGFTSQPTVTIAAPTVGVQATATAKLMLDTKVVYQINVTDGGAGYSQSSPPTVTIAAPLSGTTATAVAQVSAAGHVVAILVTSYGSGYTSAPAITFSSGAATATAILETATCRLVKESANQFPEDDPRRSLYLLVERTWETFPGPYLIEHRYEPFLDIYVSTLKRIVLGSEVPPDMTYVDVDPGQIIEYQPLSKHRAVQMISQINTGIAWENGGADFEYTGTAHWTFPNFIDEAPGVMVYYAYSGSNLDIAFGWQCRVKQGYSGACPARFVQRYTFDPENAAFQAALPEVTFIQPQSEVINNGFAYAGGNLIAQTTQFVIPETLHPAFDIDVINLQEGTGPVVNLPGPITSIPATIPESIPYGTEICVSVKPTRWKFGLWVYDLVFVTNPTPPP